MPKKTSGGTWGISKKNKKKAARAAIDWGFDDLEPATEPVAEAPTPAGGDAALTDPWDDLWSFSSKKLKKKEMKAAAETITDENGWPIELGKPKEPQDANAVGAADTGFDDDLDWNFSRKPKKSKKKGTKAPDPAVWDNVVSADSAQPQLDEQLALRPHPTSEATGTIPPNEAVDANNKCKEKAVDARAGRSRSRSRSPFPRDRRPRTHSRDPSSIWHARQQITNLDVRSAHDLCVTLPQMFPEILTGSGDLSVYASSWGRNINVTYRAFAGTDFMHYLPLLRHARLERWYTWPNELATPSPDDYVAPNGDNLDVSSMISEDDAERSYRALPGLVPRPRPSLNVIPHMELGNALLDTSNDRKLHVGARDICGKAEALLYYFSIQTAVQEFGPDPTWGGYNHHSADIRATWGRDPDKWETIYRVVRSGSRAEAAMKAFRDAGTLAVSTLFTVAMPMHTSIESILSHWADGEPNALSADMLWSTRPYTALF